MTVNERIRSRRKELNLSVDQIAEQLSVDRATVYRYESADISKLPASILEPLAKVLKTTPYYLMGWEYFDTQELSSQTIEVLKSYEKLDDADQNYVRGVIDCCLKNEKYSKKKANVS